MKELYLSQIKKIHPNLKILSDFEFKRNNVLVETKFGICNVKVDNLIRGNVPSIKTAINKNEFFINQANEIHNFKYDYSLVHYVDSRIKVEVICPIHGRFSVLPLNHLAKDKVKGCPKCGFIKNKEPIVNRCKELFEEKANKIHNFKYDYSKVVYKSSKTKIDVICKKHGIFKVMPFNHLNGSNCPHCVKENKGWLDSDYLKMAKKVNKENDCKLYIIECFDKDERFYKIGKTFNSLKQRFKKNNFPYSYNILKVTKGDPIYISKLERNYFKTLKNYKYTPLKQFAGYTECFKW